MSFLSCILQISNCVLYLLLHKCMGIRIENKRTKTIFFSFVVMLVCLFVSRAALSISMILFLLITLAHNNILQQVKDFLNNGLLVSISILFLVPFLSGAWSNDAREWMDVLRIKLPLLFFPVSFAGKWYFNKKQWTILNIVFLSILVVGCCYSLVHYAMGMKEIHEGYLKAKLIITPLENDHIRFSWLITIGVILCFLLMEQSGKKYKRLLILLIIFFTGYLHVLAARMGLMCLYVFFIFHAGWLFFNRNNKKRGIVILLSILLLPTLAWFALPTFQNRVKYFLYDISNVRSNVFLPGSNDGARILSLKGGWNIVLQNPFGTGAGDLEAEMHYWYATHAPGLPANERFLPLSEPLIYAGFAGWIGLMAVVIILVLPFFVIPLQYKNYWYYLNAMVAVNFIFDVSIEAQFGVFIYATLVLWWYKWFNQHPA